MRGSLDLFGRLLLILVGSALLIGAVGVTLIVAQEEWRPRAPSNFPRTRHVAGLIDLYAGPNPPARAVFLRAANAPDLAVSIDVAPPPLGALKAAPRLTAKLRSYMRIPTDVAAFTDPRYPPPHHGEGIEGYLARAVVDLPGGNVLVLQTLQPADQERPRLFGIPSGVWMGALAILVVLLALWLTARETRPLRYLVRATQIFNGTAVTAAPLLAGAADIRRTSQAVTDMQARVVHLLGERSLMVGAISHDLKTLLTRMRLRVAVLDDPSRARLEVDLDGMDAMLADALAFARGTASGLREHVDLADLAAAEVAERQTRGNEAGVTTELLDAPCLGDPHALRRVVSNLLDNAFKYGRGGVHLRTARHKEGVLLVVDDDGPGIPPSERAAVLAPYHRGDDPQAHRQAGSGLGLAIVEQIVRAHGGFVLITESGLGGARFTVQLPLR